MKNFLRFAAVAAIAAATIGTVQAQDELPVAGYGASRDVPGAHWLPDPDIEHKVVFDAVIAAENVDDVNPMLVAVARYVNTLAKYGVPAENRKIAVVFHQAAGPVVLNALSGISVERGVAGAKWGFSRAVRTSARVAS